MATRSREQGSGHAHPFDRPDRPTGDSRGIYTRPLSRNAREAIRVAQEIQRNNPAAGRRAVGAILREKHRS